MSDRPQDLGTTAVLPPAGPDGPPRTATQGGIPPRRRKIPIWVFVVAAIAVALLAASIVWFATRSRSSTPAPVPVPTSTVAPAVIPTPAVEATGPIVPTSTVVATPTPKTVREPTLVTKVTKISSKEYRIVVDYVQILTGKAAADAATAAGEESPPPNDYFIANTSTKLRTFSLPATASITVLGWAGADATAKKKLTVGQFMDVMPGGTHPQDEWAHGYYYVTVKAGTTVTKVEQIFFP